MPNHTKRRKETKQDDLDYDESTVEILLLQNFEEVIHFSDHQAKHNGTKR